MPPDDARKFERDLGELIGLVKGMGREIGVMREEANRRETNFQTALAEHDQRDDDRFGSVGRELEHLKRLAALVEQRDAAETVSEQRWHNWQIALVGALAVIAASLLSAVATAHLMHP